MVIVLNESDRIVRWNNEAGERFRLAADSDASLSEVFRYCWPTPEDQRAAFREVQGRGVWSGEYTQARRGHRNRAHVEVILSSLCGSKGEVAGTVIMIRDVTDRKRLDSGSEDVTGNPGSDAHRTDGEDGQVSICAECKSMRDRVDEWQPADAYLSQRFNASFVYAICPECVRRLYPQLDQESSPSPE